MHTDVALIPDLTQIAGLVGIMPDATYQKVHQLFIVDYKQFTRN